MHPLCARGTMKPEISAAVGFLSRFLRVKGLVNDRQLQTFSQILQDMMAGERRVENFSFPPSCFSHSWLKKKKKQNKNVKNNRGPGGGRKSARAGLRVFCLGETARAFVFTRSHIDGNEPRWGRKHTHTHEQLIIRVIIIRFIR